MHAFTPRCVRQALGNARASASSALWVRGRRRGSRSGHRRWGLGRVSRKWTRGEADKRLGVATVGVEVTIDGPPCWLSFRCGRQMSNGLSLEGLDLCADVLLGIFSSSLLQGPDRLATDLLWIISLLISQRQTCVDRPSSPAKNGRHCDFHNSVMMYCKILRSKVLENKPKLRLLWVGMHDNVTHKDFKTVLS